MIAFLPLVVVVVLWLLISLLWARQARRTEARLSPSTRALLLDALEEIEPTALLERLAATATHTFAPSRLMFFGSTIKNGQEKWVIRFPTANGEALDLPTTSTLALVARDRQVIGRRHGFRDDDAPLVDVGKLLDDQSLSVLLPVYHDDEQSLVAGMRLHEAPTDATLHVLEQWRITAAAVMHAQRLLHGDREHLQMANEADMAKFLEAAALSSSIEGHGQGIEWAVRFYGAADAPYFLTTYAPSAARTLVIFGRAIATGVAASLVNVSIKSCCDVMVKLLGPSASLTELAEGLNRFLWRPKNPIGVYCHILLVDRAAGRVEIASAGKSTLVRVSSSGAKRVIEKLTSQGLPLGTSVSGSWRTAASLLQPGDGLIVWTESPAGSVAEGPRFSGGVLGDELRAEELIDGALRGGAEGGCVLAAAVR